MTPKQSKIIELIASYGQAFMKKFGLIAQFEQLNEEIDELKEAVMNFKEVDTNKTEKALISEIADVLNLLQQISNENNWGVRIQKERLRKYRARYKKYFTK